MQLQSSYSAPLDNVNIHSLTHSVHTTTDDVAMSTIEEDCLPKPIGDIDLQCKAEELGIKFFLPCISTLKGSIRAELVPRSAGKALQKNGFATLAVLEAGVNANDPETMCVPDPSTLIQLPWDPEIGWLACNWYFKGKRFDQCPRLLLQTQCQKAKDMGYVMKTGIEPEFMLLAADKHEVLVPGESEFSSYQSPICTMQRKKFLGQILEYMDQLGWEPTQALHEASPNQFEVNFKYADALTQADRHLFLKFMIKELARQEGYRATFMPMPFGEGQGLCINGMHIHVSLWGVDDDQNVFPDDGGYLGLSDIGRHFMAGVLKHSKEMCGLLSPTVNSYKRLWFWPNMMHHITYGRDNRWALIRIPAATTEHDRFEYRSPDGAVNPYVLQAAVLAAGLDGLRNKTELDTKQVLEDDLWEKPEIEGLESLPGNLLEACEALEKGSFIKEQFGTGVVMGYTLIMQIAWKAYHRQITQLEIDAVNDY